MLICQKVLFLQKGVWTARPPPPPCLRTLYFESMALTTVPVSQQLRNSMWTGRQQGEGGRDYRITSDEVVVDKSIYTSCFHNKSFQKKSLWAFRQNWFIYYANGKNVLVNKQGKTFCNSCKEEQYWSPGFQQWKQSKWVYRNNYLMPCSWKLYRLHTAF